MVNLNVPRLFFVGDIGDIQRLQVQFAFECKVPNEKKKEIWKRFSKPLLESKTKPLLPKQSVKFKCKIWPEITSRFANKSLDASSL